MSSQNNRVIHEIKECSWLEFLHVNLIHSEVLAIHGGLQGILDRTLLESAIMRPQQKLFYEAPQTLAALAASYGYGLCLNHSFNDGNKRTAFAVTNVFLLLNGARIKVEQIDVVKVMYQLAAGGMTEIEFTHWIEKHLVER